MRRLELCEGHKQSHYAKHNCDYCKLEEKYNRLKESTMKIICPSVRRTTDHKFKLGQTVYSKGLPQRKGYVTAIRLKDDNEVKYSVKWDGNKASSQFYAKDLTTTLEPLTRNKLYEHIISEYENGNRIVSLIRKLRDSNIIEINLPSEKELNEIF